MKCDQLNAYADTLNRISLELAASFDEALSSVNVVRKSAADVSKSVSHLRDVGSIKTSSDGDAALMSQFFRRVDSASNAAEQTVSELDKGSFQSSLRSLSTIMGDLKRHSLELQAITSLTRITQANTPDASARSTFFVEKLRRCFTGLRESAGNAADLIDTIRSSRSEARDALLKITGRFHHLVRKVEQGALGLETLEKGHLQQMERLATDSRILGDQVSHSVGRVVSCLQFPDALAQRIDHIRTMLRALSDERPQAEKAAIAHLVARQLEAASQALAETSQKAVSALKSIAELDHDRRQALTHSTASVDWVEARAALTEMMVPAVSASRNQLDLAIALIGGIVRNVDDVRTLLEGTEHQNQELIIAVHNASILARQSGGGRSPLHILSDGVQTSVDKVSEAVSNTFDALNEVRCSSEALRESSLEKDLDVLGRIQDELVHAAREDARKVESAREAQANLSRSVEHLVSAAHEGRVRFLATDPAQQTLAGLAQQLITVTGPIPTDDSLDLRWIEELYTMNEERDVHFNVFGRLMAASDSDQVPEEEELELDGFML